MPRLPIFFQFTVANSRSLTNVGSSIIRNNRLKYLCLGTLCSCNETHLLHVNITLIRTWSIAAGCVINYRYRESITPHLLTPHEQYVPIEIGSLAYFVHFFIHYFHINIY
jgi:hypothetical protein